MKTTLKIYYFNKLVEGLKLTGIFHKNIIKRHLLHVKCRIINRKKQLQKQEKQNNKNRSIKNINMLYTFYEEKYDE